MEEDFIVLKNEIPLFALEVKSGKKRSLISLVQKAKLAGLKCPIGVIHLDNAREFLSATHIEDVLSMMNK